MIMIRHDVRPMSPFSASQLTDELERYRGDREALQARLDAVDAQLPDAEQRASQAQDMMRRATDEFMGVYRAYMHSQPYWEDPNEDHDIGTPLLMRHGVIQTNPDYQANVDSTSDRSALAARVRLLTEAEVQPIVVHANGLARERSKLASRLSYVDDQIGQLEAKLARATATEAAHPDLVDRIKVRIRRRA